MVWWVTFSFLHETPWRFWSVSDIWFVSTWLWLHVRGSKFCNFYKDYSINWGSISCLSFDDSSSCYMIINSSWRSRSYVKILQWHAWRKLKVWNLEFVKYGDGFVVIVFRMLWYMVSIIIVIFSYLWCLVISMWKPKGPYALCCYYFVSVKDRWRKKIKRAEKPKRDRMFNFWWYCKNVKLIYCG